MSGMTNDQLREWSRHIALTSTEENDDNKIRAIHELIALRETHTEMARVLRITAATLPHMGGNYRATDHLVYDINAVLDKVGLNHVA